MEDKLQLSVESASQALALTEQEQEKVMKYKQSINLNNKNQIVQYASGAQTQLVAFSETVLSQVRNKDMGAIGDTLSGLVGELKSFDNTLQKPGGFWGFLKSLKKKILYIKSQFSHVETNVNQVQVQLEKHYQTLLKDITLFDKLYEQNEKYYRELSLYIQAGEEKLQEVSATLPELHRKAEEGDPQSEKQYNEVLQAVSQFEKKLHDLKLSRMISVQLAPQIRLTQNNSTVLVDKIQSTITNTLPLWRNQMVLALGLLHSQQALDAQKAVSDATNKMLKKNSETLRTSSVKIAQESERGIVDIETLRQVNSDLFTTIDEVLKIQNESRAKRQEAEKELIAVEHEFKQKVNELAMGK